MLTHPQYETHVALRHGAPTLPALLINRPKRPEDRRVPMSARHALARLGAFQDPAPRGPRAARAARGAGLGVASLTPTPTATATPTTDATVLAAA